MDEREKQDVRCWMTDKGWEAVGRTPPEDAKEVVVILYVRQDWKPLLWLLFLPGVVYAPTVVAIAVSAIIALGMCLTFDEEIAVPVRMSISELKENDG